MTCQIFRKRVAVSGGCTEENSRAISKRISFNFLATEMKQCATTVLPVFRAAREYSHASGASNGHNEPSAVSRLGITDPFEIHAVLQQA